MLAAAEVERKDKHVEYSPDTQSKNKRKLHSRSPPYVKTQLKLPSNQSIKGDEVGG